MFRLSMNHLQAASRSLRNQRHWALISNNAVCVAVLFDCWLKDHSYTSADYGRLKCCKLFQVQGS